jgi:hypothetical protein
VPHIDNYDKELLNFDPFTASDHQIPKDIGLKLFNKLWNFIDWRDISRIESDAENIFEPSIMASFCTSDYLVRRYKDDQAFSGCMIVYAIYRDLCK